MVRPKELVEGVLYTLRRSGRLPEEANFVGYEPDIDSESIKLPLVEVSLNTQTEVREMNTDFIRFRTDGNGNQIGKVFETLYEQELIVAVWTAQGSKFDARELSNSVRDALYEHETAGPDKPLRHPEDDRPLDEVWNFRVLNGERTDDLGTSPTLRRWEETIEISASEQYLTDEQTIEGVANLNTE